MAKIRIARKSDIYAALLVFSALFTAVGIFFIGYHLKKDYLDAPPAAAAVTPAPETERGADEAAGAGEAEPAPESSEKAPETE